MNVQNSNSCKIVCLFDIIFLQWKRRGKAFLQRRCCCNKHEFAVDDKE